MSDPETLLIVSTPISGCLTSDSSTCSGSQLCSEKSAQPTLLSQLCSAKSAQAANSVAHQGLEDILQLNSNSKSGVLTALGMAVMHAPFCRCMLTNLVSLWQVRQKAAAMMFIELMFWKNASVAESVRDEYNWRVSPCCAASHSLDPAWCTWNSVR